MIKKSRLKRLQLSALFVLFLVLTGELAGCDSGPIADLEVSAQSSGRVVLLTATAVGSADWTNDYSIALAAFSPESSYAITQRVIPESTDSGGKISVTLENLPASAGYIELALTNKLRKRVLTLARIDITDAVEGTDTIRMDLGVLRLDRRGCIQRGVFDAACIQCHGANGRPAAGLDLTTQLPDRGRLAQILTDGGAATLHYNHTDVLASHFKTNLDELKAFLWEWIDNWGREE